MAFSTLEFLYRCSRLVMASLISGFIQGVLDLMGTDLHVIQHFIAVKNIHNSLMSSESEASGSSQVAPGLL